MPSEILPPLISTAIKQSKRKFQIVNFYLKWFFFNNKKTTSKLFQYTPALCTMIPLSIIDAPTNKHKAAFWHDFTWWKLIWWFRFWFILSELNQTEVQILLHHNYHVKKLIHFSSLNTQSYIMKLFCIHSDLRIWYLAYFKTKKDTL